MSRQYKVYLTPRVDKNTYGQEVEISAEIIDSGINTMKRSIDSSDYEIGVYTYGDVNIKVINKDGKYNDFDDTRSMFDYSRDLSKIRITYNDGSTETRRFKGLVNDEATKQDFDREKITFRVLSLDSVIRKTKISGGLITNGMLASEAIKTILNQAQITNILNFSSSNISVDQDFQIDNGNYFDNKNARSGLNELLFASNSVLVIDSSDNIIVKSRAESSKNILNLYGPYDGKMRQNILSVKKYNNGKHRTFNAVKINNTEKEDSGFVSDYGYKQFKKNIGFITNPSTESLIASKILEEFKGNMIEFEVIVPTYIASEHDLLDPVSINYPLRIKRFDEDSFLPTIGSTKIGDTSEPFPLSFGNVSISPNVSFKIIEISENSQKFETILKLRQFGYFSGSTSCFVGFAKIGESVICGTGLDSDKWSPALIGGAKMGKTKIA